MFDVKYSVINFNISFIESGKLGKYKESSLRGILGHALIDCNCIIDSSDRDCKNCYFKGKCIARNILSTDLKINVDFVGENEVAPFVLECSNYKINFTEGDELKFKFTLIGDQIINIPYIIFAMQFAGLTRGLSNIKFKINSVTNENNETIFDGQNIILKNILVNEISNYISKRKKSIKSTNEIKICKPLRFKKKNSLVADLEFNDLINLINRRLIVVNAIHGKEVSVNKSTKSVKLLNSNLEWNELERYSNRQKSKMKLGGIVGNISFDEVPHEYIDLLIAGELLHIGKSTSLGLGKYKIIN